MACTTATEVKAIMEVCNLTDDQIETYITSAHKYVTAVFTLDTTLSTDTKKEIETWFTAHLIASVRYRTTSKEKLGDAEVDYASKPGEGLKSTPYGEMVLLLDTTGKMAKTGAKTPSIHVIHTTK